MMPKQKMHKNTWFLSLLLIFLYPEILGDSRGFKGIQAARIPQGSRKDFVGSCRNVVFLAGNLGFLEEDVRILAGCLAGLIV